ncbi:general stress protein [Nonomuraea sp. NPDC046802]|uniref:general stress protein n=1 Tax=Nonomuraea sp. NPDC046802 TaxID=3154919 RepID=UPI0033D96733
MIETAPAIASAAAGGDRPVVGSYDTCEQAREAVAFLADNGIPAHRVGIVGENLRLMENVLGRMTTPCAAGMGAALGAWFGLPSSLMVLLVAGPWAALLAGMAFGALLGAAFGVTACWAARGRGDLLTTQSPVAARYAVVADLAIADDARNLLIKHGWRTG